MRRCSFLILLFVTLAGPAEAASSPLITAALRGDLKQVKFLLAHGAAVNARDKDGRTALLEVAQHGEVPIMTLLIENGANVNLRDNEGNSALKLVLSGPAAASDAPVFEGTKRREINLLLNHGADVNAKDKDGDTTYYFSSRMAQ